MNIKTFKKTAFGQNNTQKYSMAPNRLPSVQGKFTLNSGIQNSNKTRLMATPMMSAETKKAANVTKNTPPNIDSSTIKKVFSSGVLAAAAASA